MKLTKICLSLLLLCGAIVSCQKKEQAPHVTPSFLIEGVVVDSSLTQVYTVVETALNQFTLDTVAVENNRFQYSFPTDSVVFVTLYTDSVQTSFYTGAPDTITTKVSRVGFMNSGLSLPYAQVPIERFAALSGDSIQNLPMLVANQIREYRTNTEKIVIGNKLPYALFKDNGSRTFSSLELTGNARLYSFWASYDTTSVLRLIDLEETMEAMDGKAVEFVNISFDRNDSIWKETVTRLDIEGRNARLPEGFSNTYAVRMNVQTLPYNILVDSLSRILRVNIYGEELTEFLKENVKGKLRKSNIPDGWKTHIKPEKKKEKVKEERKKLKPKYPVEGRKMGFKIKKESIEQ